MAVLVNHCVETNTIETFFSASQTKLKDIAKEESTSTKDLLNFKAWGTQITIGDNQAADDELTHQDKENADLDYKPPRFVTN